MGLVSYAYNKDHKSVKTTFRWMVNLCCGGSDSQEDEYKQKRVLKFLSKAKNEEAHQSPKKSKIE